MADKLTPQQQQQQYVATQGGMPYYPSAPGAYGPGAVYTPRGSTPTAGGLTGPGVPQWQTDLNNIMKQTVPNLSAAQMSGYQAPILGSWWASALKNAPQQDVQQLLDMQVPGGKKGETLQNTPLGQQLMDALQAAPPGGAKGGDPSAPGGVGANLITSFQQAMAPWLANQAQGYTAEDQTMQTQMAQALQGASPAVRAAYQATDPSMEAAMAMGNQASQQNITATPEFGALIAQLQAQTNAYKQAQTAAQEEPYVAAATSGGTIGGQPVNSLQTGTGTSGTSLGAMIMAALQGQGQGAPGAGTANLSAVGNSPTPAQVAANSAAQFNYGQYGITSGLGG